jgi:glutathione S-transferase
VLDRRLADREFVAGDYSIADMAIWPWIVPWERQGQNLREFPNVKRWFEVVGDRPAVRTGRWLGKDLGRDLARAGREADAQRAVLFGQRARKS